MSDPNHPVPTPAGDALLARIGVLHDDDPQQAAALLRGLDPATVSPGKLTWLAFLLDHLFGEKFDRWPDALAGQRALVAHAGAQATPATPAIFRQAAIAAQMAGDAGLTHEWTQALAASADAPLAKARALVSLGAVGFSVSRMSAEQAGRLTLQALQPLAALHATPGNGLDAAFGAVANNLASELLERPVDDLGQPDLRIALQLSSEHAQRFWERAGTWVNHERAHTLSAMAANALGLGADAVAQARAGLALLDEFDDDGRERVDRAFLELELALGLRLAQLPGRAEALARALALAAQFEQPGLSRWFAQRSERNEALAAHYGR